MVAGDVLIVEHDNEELKLPPARRSLETEIRTKVPTGDRFDRPTDHCEI